MAEFRLVFKNKAFPAVRHTGAVNARINSVARQLAERANNATDYGGYEWDEAGGPQRDRAYVFTGDWRSALDSAVHSTLQKIVSGAGGMS